MRTMLLRDDFLYLPGHGPPLPNPRPYVEELLNHRVKREQAILRALHNEPHTSQALVDRLYLKSHPWLKRAAERNVVAHLLKMQMEGLVIEHGDCWRAKEPASDPR